MSLTLFVGDYAYSSWSLRGWLLLDAFGVPFQHRYAHMRTEAFEALRRDMAPSRLVPALKIADAEGERIVWDTLAMAETLHEMYPDAGYWPKGAAARALARSLTAEMHSGFAALRGACPMNMRRRYAGFEVDTEVQADLERLDQLWALALDRHDQGPYLFGAFTVADAFYAPVASRIDTYDLPIGVRAREYVSTVLSHPSVARWQAMALADGHIQEHYEFDMAYRA